MEDANWIAKRARVQRRRVCIQGGTHASRRGVHKFKRGAHGPKKGVHGSRGGTHMSFNIMKVFTTSE
jgi:hypothetical protein